MTVLEAPRCVGLSWGIKRSLLTYVRESGGDVSAFAPAHDRNAGSFWFPETCRRRGEDAVVWEFEGAVRLSAHAGLMEVLLSAPWIHVTPSETLLTVAGSEATRTQGRRVPLAILSGTPGVPPSEGEELSAALHPAGAVFFDFRYSAGAALDTVSVVSG